LSPDPGTECHEAAGQGDQGEGTSLDLGSRAKAIKAILETIT
jgi:hypothetical protein